MTFDPTKMGKQPASSQSKRGPRAQRLFILVDNYETPANGFHYAVGHEAGKPDSPVRVRLNTVNERQGDRPDVNVAKIEEQYVTGGNIRESIAQKKQADIKLLSFDDARLVSTNEGVREFRAHWSKTMSTNPEAEVITGLAHIHLREGGQVGETFQKQQAYVEVVKTGREVGADIADRLHAALSIQDAQGRARDPFAVVRVSFDGKVAASPRIYPSRETTKSFDQLRGESKDVTHAASADNTMAALLSGQPGRNDMENRSLDTIRAVVAGLQQGELPVLNSADETVRNDITNLYYGAKGGHLNVEVVGLEKIDFGPDSRKTYVTDRDKPQLAAYTIKEAAGDGKVRESNGFAQTVVTVMRHPDGEPYAVFASPSDMYPTMKKFNALKLDASTEATLEASNSAEHEAGHEVAHEEPEYQGSEEEMGIA